MKIVVNGNEINYDIQGPQEAPVILLSHALATNLNMWESQTKVLSRTFRVLRYDTLGHGATATPPGPVTLDQLAGQAGGLLDALGIAHAHFLGISMGGMIGQTLALARPKLLTSLTLCNSSSRMPAEAQPLWKERIKIAESEGMEPLVEPTIGRWFTPPFRQAQPQVIDRVRGWIRATPPAGYTACCHAIAALDLIERIPAIKLPTLVIAAEEDPGTPATMSRSINERIAGSELVMIPAASHLANLEQADIFNRTLSSFLDRIAGR
jgi:3-oxoadipate enol-lactonase